MPSKLNFPFIFSKEEEQEIKESIRADEPTV
jgi:hypothetical protein